MIALLPKSYYITDHLEETVKQKGVTIDENRNTHLDRKAFESFANNGKVIDAQNIVLRTKDTHMTKQLMNKTGLSGVNTKSVV
jgi:HD superfamily phosphohydrolase YqeK